MRPIPLAGDISVKKFHSFLFADPHPRPTHSRFRLSIAYRESPLRIEHEEENFTSLLVGIITSCPNLEHVETTFAGGSAHNNKPVVLAIAALTTLRSLSVGGSSPSAFDILLCNISSPLHKLAVHSAYIRYPDALEKFLPLLAPTLAKLELIHFGVYRGGESALDDPLVSQADEGQPHDFRTLSQYPAVRSLSVICFTAPPLVDCLQHLLPRTRRHPFARLGLSERMMNMYSADAIREANQRAQEGSPTGA